MKTLAALIERELQREKWSHYAVYEHAKIAKFAKENGFRLRFYRMGMCAIFDKGSTTNGK